LEKQLFAVVKLSLIVQLQWFNCSELLQVFCTAAEDQNQLFESSTSTLKSLAPCSNYGP